MARNHQVLGVNNAVASVLKQEELKSQFPVERRLNYRIANVEMPERKIVTEDDAIQYTETISAPMSVNESSPRTIELPLSRELTLTWVGLAFSGIRKVVENRTRWLSLQEKYDAVFEEISHL